MGVLLICKKCEYGGVYRFDSYKDPDPRCPSCNKELKKPNGEPWHAGKKKSNIDKKEE